MGFDVDGNTGNYFRNNVWWWRPLWQYVCEKCQDFLTDEDQQSGFYNDFYEITDKKAADIAERLENEIKSGATRRWEETRNKLLAAMPPVKCDICNGTGKRNDNIIVGECNACEGKGKVPAWETHYGFCEDNVKEFAKFCRESEGFRIG